MNKLVTFEIKKPTVSFNVSSASSLRFDLQAVLIEGGGKPYNGPYEVSPEFDTDIELPTKGTMPKEDIAVLKIPKYEVSNESGGTTLIIGGELHA